MNDLLHRIDTFVQLGMHLKGFGQDKASTQCMQQAIVENRWFSAEEILLAIDAIRSELLERKKIEDWIKPYSTAITKCQPQRIAIIMAGNIPLVGFFDLMCALICGHSVAIKPSSKDRALMEYVCRTLNDIDPQINIAQYNPEADYDKIIATGGDSAARHFSQCYATTPSLIRGSRHSAALLDGNESKAELEGLYHDIFSYSGMGCRNISLLLLPEGYTPPIVVPKMNEMFHGNYLHHRAMLTMQGVTFNDHGGALTVEQDSFSDALSIINIMRYRTIGQAEEWLKTHDEQLQCVVSHCSLHPRCVAFGRAQYPALTDYADGIDVIKFLTA